LRLLSLLLPLVVLEERSLWVLLELALLSLLAIKIFFSFLMAIGIVHGVKMEALALSLVLQEERSL